MCKSTDVAGSIAGYYYQILLACREITNNIPDLEEVGIEAGADVRIIKRKGIKSSIEAKFHKKNMSRYNKEIIKTIYNFYRNSKEDEKLEFSTNVAPTSEHKDFFDKWNNKELTSEEMNTYILKCIFRHCCFNVNKYNKKYSEYKNSIIQKDGKEEREPYYINMLEADIFNENINDEELKKYSFINSNNLDEEFSKKLFFTFYDAEKLDTIKNIKEDINKNLQSICEAKKITIYKDDYEKIRDLIVDKFFMIITENASLKSEHLFNEIKKFSKIDLNNCIDNYKHEKIEFLNQSILKRLIDSIENEEIKFINMIDSIEDFDNKEKLIIRHSEIQQLFLDKIIDIDKYNRFISIYTLEGFDSFEVILKLINQLTILSVYKHINIEDVSFLIENNESLDNVFIKDLINYSFKACPSAYRNFGSIIKIFYSNTSQKYSIKPNEIVVFEADFGFKERPCEKKQDSLNCVLDIAMTDENLEREIALYKSINYRCSDCIYIAEKNSETIENLDSFLNCRGCRK